MQIVGILLVILVLILGSADKLKTPRNIKLQGAVSGNANFDGSKDVVINTTQDNIKILTGTLNTGQATITPLPTGFTPNNSIIISIMTQNPTKINQWAIGTTFDSSSYVSGSLPIRAYIQDNGIVIQAKNINFSDGLNVFDGPSFNYKLVLMKIS